MDAETNGWKFDEDQDVNNYIVLEDILPIIYSLETEK